MNTPSTIGLDLARRTSHKAVIINSETDSEPQTLRVSSCAESLDAMLEAAGATDCTVVLEPTGMAWLPVSAWLQHRGCRVIRVDTRSAHEFRKFVRRNVKSDRVDAEALARMPAANPRRVRFLQLAPAELFALDRLARTRARLVSDRTRVVLQLHAIVETYVPELAGALGTGESLSAVKRFLLHRFLHPKQTLEAGTEGIAQALRDDGLCPSNVRLLARWVEAARNAWSIWGPMLEAGTCPIDFEIAQIEVDLALDRIAELDDHIARIERRIDSGYRAADPDRLLESIPGIGSVIAPYLLATVGDVRRFPNGDHFASFCGLVPRKNQTGSTDRQGQAITKAGNRLLRKYLYLAADTARRCDLELAAFYAHKCAEGKHHTEAVIAVANKLARRVYAVLKRAAHGDPTPYRFVDDHGGGISAKASRQLVSARHLSKSKQRAAQAKGRGAKARKKRQPDDSATRSVNGSPTTTKRNSSDGPNATDRPSHRSRGFHVRGLDRVDST